MPSFEKGPPASPEKKPDYTREDEEKRQRALGRQDAIRRGKVREFDEEMRKIDEGESSPQEVPAETRRTQYYEGTVDKSVLTEAARRKMFAGGTRPLKEFIADVVQERESKNDGNNSSPSQEKKAA